MEWAEVEWAEVEWVALLDKAVAWAVAWVVEWVVRIAVAAWEVAWVVSREEEDTTITRRGIDQHFFKYKVFDSLRL